MKPFTSRTIVHLIALMALLVVSAVPQQDAAAIPTSSILITNLQPSWTAAGGGGVYSAYIGPPAYGYVSPGTTALFDGREAGIIKAGLTVDPTSGIYEDEGLFGWAPTLTINTLAAGTLNYDVENEKGDNAVWMTIEIDTGTLADRSDNTTFQYVPAFYGSGWNTVNADAGSWQKWNNDDGDVTGSPFMTLDDIAADVLYTGLNVVRMYLRLGMGDAYNTPDNGTIGWVDKVVIGSQTYDFVQPTNVYVDDSWAAASIGDDPDGAGPALYYGNDSFDTIQEGVDRVASGGTVNVAAGTYVETGQIVIDKNLSIVGASAATTIVKPAQDTGADGDARGWILANAGVTFNLSGVTLDGTGRLIREAIRLNGSGTIASCSITNIAFEQYRATAIALYGDSTDVVNVNNCAFSNIGRNGILTLGPITGTFSDNTYTGKGAGDWLDYGIEIQYGAHATITNNTISNNVGVAVSDGSVSSAVTVWDDSGNQATLTGNTFTNNHIGVAIAAFGYGDDTEPVVTIGSGNLFDGGDIGISIENVGDTSTPTLTFGASTYKGQTDSAFLLQDGMAVGATYDISSAIFQTAGGAAITDNAAKELLVYHLLDATNRGLFLWNVMPVSDFDGDDDTDLGVFRPSTGVWYIRNQFNTTWGTTGDVPVPADYDGDGDTDVAIWRPSTGIWYVKGVFNSTWGSAGDVPVPGDYDGDGTTDVAVWRPSDGNWYVKNQFTSHWGASGDTPVQKDYDGDGDTDLAVFRPSTGVFYIKNQLNTSWGSSTDIPVPGDYNADGAADVAIFRPSTGVWYVKGLFNATWGTTPGDIPVPADYDADSDADIAVWRPSNGTWYVKDQFAIAWGSLGDFPLPAPDTNGDGDPYQ